MLRCSIRSLLALKKSWRAKESVGKEDMFANISRSSKISGVSRTDVETKDLLKVFSAKSIVG